MFVWNLLKILLYRYCEARRQKLLDFVYEGYEADIWEFIDS